MPRKTSRQPVCVAITCLTLKMSLHGCTSLKEKRSVLAPLQARLHKEFNISISEIDLQDIWQSSILGVVVISTDADHNSKVLNMVLTFIDSHFPSVMVEKYTISNL